MEKNTRASFEARLKKLNDTLNLYPTERAMLYQCCNGLDREMYLIRFELVFNVANFGFVITVLLKEQWCVLLL